MKLEGATFKRQKLGFFDYMSIRNNGHLGWMCKDFVLNY
jgi:hypothetical protein